MGLLARLAAVGGYAAWTIWRQGGGGNFPSISLGMLVPDLLNAFSMGLSVVPTDVSWLDWLYGLIAAWHVLGFAFPCSVERYGLVVASLDYHVRLCHFVAQRISTGRT